jgi:TolB-like protein/Flp pilus assembly protein TadD
VNRFGRFLAELRRRRVYRVAVAYAVVGLGLLEGTDILVPALGLPARTVTVVAVLALVGFPIALFLAWTYQITSDGVESTAPADPGPTPGPVVPLLSAAVTIAFVAFALGWLLRPAAPGVAAHEGGMPIAVLPFTNISGPDDEYFTAGLHEEVISHLAHSPGFRVTSRTSVLGYESDPKPMREVAAELGVVAILEGSVRRAGNTLRMTAQLIDARQDVNLWSATYDRGYSMDEILAIQRDVATEVAAALRVVLTDGEGELAPPTHDLEAYELYLLGRHHWSARTPADLRRSIELFEQATRQDSTFARAWAGLADAYAVLPAYDPDATTGETTPLAKEAATRALSLDPGLAEAHATLGFVAFTHDWAPDVARDHFERALELNPSHAPALYWQGWFLGLVGEPEAGAASLERALAVAPRSVAALFSVGSAYLLVGNYDRAREVLTRAVELDAGVSFVWWDLGSVEYLDGDLEAAIQAWTRTVELMGWNPGIPSALTRLPLDVAGARTTLRTVLPLETIEPSDASGALPFFALVRDTVAVVSLIETIHETRPPGIPRLYQLPYLADFLDLPELAPLSNDFRERFGIE